MTGFQIALVVITSLAVCASAFAIRQSLCDLEDARDYDVPPPARRWHVPTWAITAALLAAFPLSL
ncbi:hypothetical protein [Seohaeicola zhoushanensis]|uniref:Uncharacterized protein n=1 Tax=Seohaeicola zhoushanensis TaxID=1569283 RepID=A0A8J3H2W9_9RHOB|nr:hypothetical protein [Seohaeicola zhoushanensis]GHF70991.1 hypothetical protein GCM10017056_47380 [Seohaeicola zhoushanensis]